MSANLSERQDGTAPTNVLDFQAAAELRRQRSVAVKKIGRGRSVVAKDAAVLRAHQRYALSIGQQVKRDAVRLKARAAL